MLQESSAEGLEALYLALQGRERHRQTPADKPKRPPAPPLMPARAARNIAGLQVCLCRECLRPFAKKRIDQKFCDQPCRRKWNARIEARRSQAYEAGMAMRNKAKGGFSALTNLFDRWKREDRKRDEDYAAACLEKGIEA